ncbi:hypothetical protein [Bradyrhizobium manausense]|uniref:Uncharacterized protein n=1 Tax=Bradyrhizobium manausense TaxID=989370 RepID=A0A0R3DQS3_9BRAD|nr:hypothetical protein [Bradyrhizobium manausense]KRQ10148.1 hypothetical protein AOQ71_19435 [Bradyrhizobium manausense]
MLLVIDRGFDLTDEAMYLYDMEHAGPSSGTHIYLIAGRLGHLFHNNIVVWRVISLCLNMAGSLIFAAGFWRLGTGLGLFGNSRSKSDRTGFFIAILIGSLGYYGVGPPSLSSNSVAAFGLVSGTGLLALAVTAAPGIRRHVLIALSSLAIVLLEAARISAGAGYLLAAPAMLWLASTLLGWQATIRLALVHILFGVLWTIVLATAFDAWQQILPVIQLMLSTGNSEGSSYNYGVLAEQHLVDLFGFAWQSLRYAAAAVGAGLLASLPLGWRAFFTSPSPPVLRQVRASVLFFAALLPLIPLWDYLSLVNIFANWPSGLCADAAMIVCDQPIGMTGRPFMYAVGGQIVVAALFAMLDRLPPKSAPFNETGRWTASAWSILLVLLLILTIVTSLGTNTGLLAHSIFCMGPLMAAGYIALTHAGLRLGRIPGCVAPVSLICFSLLVVVSIAHNRLFFPYRLDGTIFRQTTRLDHPPELKGLKVSASLSSELANIERTLLSAGFDPQRDLVLPIYNMPGLIVGTNTRAFGFAWLDTGPGWDEINCHRIKTDPADLRSIGRLFVLSNSPASPALANCLRERGVDMAAEQRIATIPVEATPPVKVGIVPIP